MPAAQKTNPRRLVAPAGVSDRCCLPVTYAVRSDPNLTQQELLAYLKENLTGYKVPREIIFREELPKTNVGKILRRKLRDESVAS